MNFSFSADVRQKLVTAYLGHRLNHSELVALTDQAQAEPNSFEPGYEELTARNTDQRDAFTPEELENAWSALGLKERFDSLDENTVWSGEERALHRRLSRPEHDPSSADEVLPSAPLNATFASVVEQNFDSWDRNGNTRLELEELDYLMAGGVLGEKLELANDPKLAPALTVMMRYDRLLGSARPDGEGISRADIEAWRNDPELVASGTAGLVNEAFIKYSEEATLASFDQPLFSESLSPTAIHQGVAGSCVLLATAAGSSADQLRSMLTDNGDGVHTVTFADGVSETVAEPSLAARLYHSSGEGMERWPAVFEIAAAQRLLSQGRGAKQGLRGTIEGISPEFAIPAFTGRATHQESLDELTLAQTRELMNRATESQGPVICGSRPRATSDFINHEELHNGIANGHCYSILSYDGESDQVKLQNPWHKTEWAFAQDGVDDGVFEMPLRDFYASFRWLAYAG